MTTAVSLDEIDDAVEHMAGAREGSNKQDSMDGKKMDEYDKKLEQYYGLLCQQSIFDDLLSALYDVRFAAPLVAIFAMFLAYHITVAPYRVHIERGLAHAPTSLDLDLSTVRPVISAEKQNRMQRILLHAETHLELPTFENIRFKFFSSVPEHGNFRLPQMFYQGVTFGITAENSHNIEHTSYSPFTLQDMEAEFRSPSFKPKPTFLMRRSVVSNDSLWEESGFALYYSYQDLQSTVSKLSSDVERPWKRILEPVLDIARKYKQAYVTVWYPRAFGAAPTEAQLQRERDRRRLEADVGASSPIDRIPAIQQEEIVREINLLPPRLTTQPRRDSPDTLTRRMPENFVSTVHRTHPLQHSVLLQEIVPTRTGLDGLKCSSVVWLSAVDDIAPHLIDFVRLDDW